MSPCFLISGGVNSCTRLISRLKEIAAFENFKQWKTDAKYTPLYINMACINIHSGRRLNLCLLILWIPHPLLCPCAKEYAESVFSSCQDGVLPV